MYHLTFWLEEASSVSLLILHMLTKKLNLYRKVVQNVRYLAGLRVVENVHGAWFNTVGLDSLVEGKTAPPPSTISTGEGSIVPVYE